MKQCGATEKLPWGRSPSCGKLMGHKGKHSFKVRRLVFNGRFYQFDSFGRNTPSDEALVRRSKDQRD